MATPRSTRAQTLTPLSVRTRSTPQPTPSASSSHLSSHHKTADELALEEAASILHTPTARLRSSASVGPELLEGSARALRHKRLTEVRQEGDLQRERSRSRSPQSDEKARDKSQAEEVDESGEEDLSQRTIVNSTTEDEDEDDEASRELGMGTLSDIGSVQHLEEDDGSEDEEGAVPVSAPLSTGQIFAQAREAVEFGEADTDSGSETASGGSSSSESESESGSGSDSESESESDSDDDDEMEKLLQAARDAVKAKGSVSTKGKEVVGNEEDEEAVLQFDEDQLEKKHKEAPIPDLAVPNLPKTHLVFPQKGASTAGPSKRQLPSDATKAPEVDDRPYERPLTKKEKALQPRKATTSELWASVPTPRADLLPQMRKDYQALALSNTLDPKRFMKGGSKSDKVPESFAIGTMVETSRKLRDTTITKEQKYRPGQVVKNIIRDEDMEAYAKRKYGDLQWSKMENGRGKGWKKRAKWQ